MGCCLVADVAGATKALNKYVYLSIYSHAQGISSPTSPAQRLHFVRVYRTAATKGPELVARVVFRLPRVVCALGDEHTPTTSVNVGAKDIVRNDEQPQSGRRRNLPCRRQ